MASEKKMDVVILGLLKHEPMTGYEIKKHLDTSLKYFWSGSFGSIYTTLNALEKAGAVKKAGCESGGRGKISYTLTETGNHQLKEWLSHPNCKNELKYETMVKLFFGSQLGREETLHHIEAFENEVSQDLAKMKFFEKNLMACQGDEDHLYYLLTVRFGIETYKGHLKWCEEAKRVLSNANKS